METLPLYIRTAKRRTARQGLNDLVCELVRIRRRAESFPEFGVGNQFNRVMPDQWLGICLWIDNCEFDVERAVVHASILFDDAHLVAEPGSAVEAIGLDDE